MRKIFFLILFLTTLSGIAQTPVFNIVLKINHQSCKPGTALVTVAGGSGPISVSWSNGGAGVFQNNLDSGLYSVVVSDTTGLPDHDSLIYFHIDLHRCGISASQSFSPNGDGINDYWGLSGVENFTEFDVQIFNRWGQKVKEFKNEFEKWDGTAFGLPVPDGTYYVIIEYTDPHYGKQTDKNSITIIR